MRHYGPMQVPSNHRTAWGPFFERKTRKMSPHGGRRKRDLKKNNWNLTPIVCARDTRKRLQAPSLLTTPSKQALLRHPQKSPPKRAFLFLPTDVGQKRPYLPSAAGAAGASAGALMAAGVAAAAGAARLPPWKCIITGTISSATMLMILIKGLIAGPAVSL